MSGPAIEEKPVTVTPSGRIVHGFVSRGGAPLPISSFGGDTFVAVMPTEQGVYVAIGQRPSLWSRFLALFFGATPEDRRTWILIDLPEELRESVAAVTQP